MMKVLAIKSGIFGDNSNSNTLVNSILQKLEAKHGDITVTTRDLVAQPLPYFDAQVVGSIMEPAESRTTEQSEAVALSDAIIDEVKSADIIVLGMPMYNFGVTAQFKTWLDYLLRVGVTFHYTELGPEGMLSDKPVYVACARGGIHFEQPTDTQTPYLKITLGFIGLKDLRFAYAEGLAMGDEAKAQGISRFEEVTSEMVVIQP